MKVPTKVSKKLKLSKAKRNYRKDERRAIHRRERRIAAAVAAKDRNFDKEDAEFLRSLAHFHCRC